MIFHRPEPAFARRKQDTRASTFLKVSEVVLCVPACLSIRENKQYASPALFLYLILSNVAYRCLSCLMLQCGMCSGTKCRRNVCKKVGRSQLQPSCVLRFSNSHNNSDLAVKALLLQPNAKQASRDHMTCVNPAFLCPPHPCNHTYLKPPRFPHPNHKQQHHAARRRLSGAGTSLVAALHHASVVVTTTKLLQQAQRLLAPGLRDGRGFLWLLAGLLVAHAHDYLPGDFGAGCVRSCDYEGLSAALRTCAHYRVRHGFWQGPGAGLGCERVEGKGGGRGVGQGRGWIVLI